LQALRPEPHNPLAPLTILAAAGECMSQNRGHHGRSGRQDDHDSGHQKKIHVLIGTRDDDPLVGTDGKDLILGRKGDDQIDGGAGNDLLFGGWGEDLLLGGLGNDLLIGGKGDDLLDGGEGSDIVLAGEGDDTVNHTLPENVDAKGYYDGGKGFDTLRLTLTTAEMQLAQQEIDAFKAFLENGGKVFHFEGFDLTVRNFEALEIVTIGGNTAPVAADDDFATDEDAPTSGNVLANDTDVEDGRPALVSAVNGSAGNVSQTITLDSGALLTVNADGSFSYDPNGQFEALGENEFAQDSFSYVARDSDGTDSDTAAVKIVIGGVNEAPVAADDTITGSFSARIKVAVVGLDAGGFDGSSYVAAAGQLDPALFDATAIAHTAAADWAAILAGYDVAVIGDDGIGADYTGSGIFSALRDFVDAGGGVVTTGWFATRLSEYTADPVTADADYITPAASGAPSFAPSGATIDVVDPSHPVTSGISEGNYTVDAVAHDLAVAADPTATVLATYTPAGGAPLQAIAVDEVGAGRTAFLGSIYMANETLFNPSALRLGVADQIFERAVTWAAGERETAATDEDSVLEILRSTLLANDSDVDGDALAIALLSAGATSKLGAALSINSAGNIEYDPRTALDHLEEGVVVDDSFVYEVDDGNGGTDPAIVSLKVLGLAEPAPTEVTTLASFEESLYSGLDQPLAAVTADADTLL
jgi:VCBS repeat-containing protein